MSKKVFIQGASIAALTSAARLSKFKYEVTVDGEIYKNTEIAGFTFDTGAPLTLPAVYRDFFQKTGKHLGQVLDIKAMDPAFVFKFGDLTITFANLSRSARLAEIESKLGTAAANEWDLLLKQGEYLWDRIRDNYVEWEFSPFRFDLSTYMRMRAPYIQNPYLRKILAHYATYLGYPADIYKWSQIAAFVEESFGIWQIQGGIGALTEVIKNRAIELGVIFGKSSQFDYFIDATEIHNSPAQRLLGLNNYPEELPVRTIIFNENGLTTDVYAAKLAPGKYSLVINGELGITEYDKYAVVDQIRDEVEGDADNQILTHIRTANKRRFKVKHVDSLAHAGITGELLANAVRGVKNRPSHEH